MAAEWRLIPGYGWDYEISSEGEIFSLKRNKLRRICQIKGRNVVGLYFNGVQMPHRIDRLVLLAFRPIQRAHAFTPRHKNEITTDDRLENLEWIPIRNGAILNEDQVQEIRLRWESTQDTLRAIGQAYGVDDSTISSIITGHIWTESKPLARREVHHPSGKG